MTEWQHIDIGEGSITLSRRALHGKLYLTADDPAYSEEISLADAKKIVKAFRETYGPEVLWDDEHREKPAGGTSSDIDHTKLIPKEAARHLFAPDSRSQDVITEIYRGGTRADIVQRLWETNTFGTEIEFLPGYVQDILQKIQKKDS